MKRISKALLRWIERNKDCFKNKEIRIKENSFYFLATLKDYPDYILY